MSRVVRLAVSVFAAAVLLAGCGSSGPTASSVVEELSALYPAPNPRDNTGSCAGDGGCVQLVTTDAVSVYQWPDEATARRFAGGSDAVDVVGPFALSYRGAEQQATSEQARAAYAQRVRELLAAG